MDCYDELLKYYNENETFDSDQMRVWMNQFLIKLMKEFHEADDHLRVRNCLILLVNLFFNISYPDHYHKKGETVKKLKEHDRSVYIKLLKKELNN